MIRRAQEGINQSVGSCLLFHTARRENVKHSSQCLLTSVFVSVAAFLNASLERFDCKKNNIVITRFLGHLEVEGSRSLTKSRLLGPGFGQALPASPGLLTAFLPLSPG